MRAAMAERRLNPDEAEIWAKVAASVRRLEGQGPVSIASAVAASVPQKPGIVPVAAKSATSPLDKKMAVNAGATTAPADTLDGGWDRRLRRGLVRPERSVDLHGHNLVSAHAYLDSALERAVADGVRVLLVVTGKPPRDPAPHRRGLIRASIGDWLASSRHAGRIAAVRNAHPRHGGAGALYVILRRERSG